MSLSDCPKCWDTPCTCGHEWHYPNYKAILSAAGISQPRAPLYLNTLSRLIYKHIATQYEDKTEAQDKSIEIAQEIIKEYGG